VNIFRGKNLDETRLACLRGPGGPHSRSSAAGRTVGLGSRPIPYIRTSCAAGDPAAPILYEVDRIRGRAGPSRPGAWSRSSTAGPSSTSNARSTSTKAQILSTRQKCTGTPPDHLPTVRERLEALSRPATGLVSSWIGHGRLISVTSATCHGCNRESGDRQRLWGTRRRGAGPTTGCCTLQWSPTPRTCPSIDSILSPTRSAGRKGRTWSSAWTTACGSTARSGQTGGSSSIRILLSVWSARAGTWPHVRRGGPPGRQPGAGRGADPRRAPGPWPRATPLTKFDHDTGPLRSASGPSWFSSRWLVVSC